MRGLGVYVRVCECVFVHACLSGRWVDEWVIFPANQHNMYIFYLEYQGLSVRYHLNKVAACLWLLGSVSGCLSVGISSPLSLCSVASVSSFVNFLVSLIDSVCQLCSFSAPLCSSYLGNLGRIRTLRVALHLWRFLAVPTTKKAVTQVLMCKTPC